MTLNAKPIILWDNLFNRSTPTAATATGFDPLNLIDWRRHTLWKADSLGTRTITVDLNQVLNPGFETGDGTGWTLGDSVIATADKFSGTYSVKLIATESSVNGALTDAISVDTTKTYRHISKHNVAAYAAGNYRMVVSFADLGGNSISEENLNAWTATTSGWESVNKSIGPAGSGADLEFPAGTVSVRFRHVGGDSPDFTANMDDVLFYEETAPDRWGMVNHNFWSANATVSLESSDDETEVITTTTTRVAGFTPPDNKAIWKTFPLIGTPQRMWRIKIVTANIAPYLGMIFLGAKLEFPRYMVGEWDPQPYTVRGTTGTSEGGNWLGATPQPYVSENTLFMRNITDAFVRDTFGPVFNNHIRQLLPWMLVWDETNHDADVFLMRLRDGSRKSFPYTPTLRTITLEVNTVVEE